jgi:hypothetical protein
MNGMQRYGANLFYWYAWGYKSRDAALEALDTLYCDGDVSPGELPRIETYRNRDGATRYGIMLAERAAYA